ncbi:MAG TPA: hypothetical protein DDZ38_04090, partial [Gammaproteobacteria bacterium]|nr:hypothetical protein [Gammaproteobacteria bacterium]
PLFQRTDVVSGIVGAEITSANPQKVANRFAEFIGRDLDDDGLLQLDEGYLSFIQGAEGARDRLTAIYMRASDRARAGETFEFARTTIRLV